MKKAKKQIFTGRGNKNPNPTKVFRLAEDIGSIASEISARYQLLSISDPNKAAMLLDELEKLADNENQ